MAAAVAEGEVEGAVEARATCSPLNAEQAVREYASGTPGKAGLVLRRSSVTTSGRVHSYWST
eukprot:scaffold71900_cov57-Phaeocystis_antarctica.AAC.1